MENIFNSLLRLLGIYSDFKHNVVSWFIRIIWAPCLLWGIYDGVYYVLGKDKTEEDLTNFYIRTITGVVLFIIWFFLLRRKQQ